MPSPEMTSRGEIPRLRQEFLLRLEPCSAHCETYERSTFERGGRESPVATER